MGRVRSFFARLILKFVPLQILPTLNRRLYIFMGHQIDKNVVIYSSTEILGSLKVKVGENSFIGHKCLLMGGNSTISIGKNCDISSNVSLIGGSHEAGESIRRAGIGISKDISIGDGSWIGFGSIILGGVEIGAGSIIAAGSVVNKSFPPNVLIAGVPAKIIKYLGKVNEGKE
jgi:maltose O-acetyltransferase